MNENDVYELQRRAEISAANANAAYDKAMKAYMEVLETEKKTAISATVAVMCVIMEVFVMILELAKIL